MKNLLVAVLLAAFAFAQPAAAVEGYRPDVAAHRGASGYLPEHTLPAKAMAYAMGVDYIEQDVVMSKDGRLMVMHDVVIDTTTDVAKKFPGRARADGRYYSCDFTYDELKSLRVTERFNPATGKPIFPARFPDSPIDYSIPSLEEEFLQVQGLNKSTGQNISVYVEVKEPAFFEKQGLDILKATIEMMTRYGYNNLESRAILQIFDYDSVVRARELGWKGELCMLVTASGQGHRDDKARHAWLCTEEGVADVAKYATIFAPNFNLLAVPSEDSKSYTISPLGELARKHGMKLHTWTLRKDSLPKGFRTFGEALDVTFDVLKVDGVFSDFPDSVVNYLRDKKLR